MLNLIERYVRMHCCLCLCVCVCVCACWFHLLLIVLVSLSWLSMGFQGARKVYAVYSGTIYVAVGDQQPVEGQSALSRAICHVTLLTFGPFKTRGLKGSDIHIILFIRIYLYRHTRIYTSTWFFFWFQLLFNLSTYTYPSFRFLKKSCLVRSRL